MATISDLSSIAAATGAGYALATLSNQGGAQIVTFTKDLKAHSGQSGFVQAQAMGVHASILTTAETLALASLNKQRKHRYAGSPGAADSATVVAHLDGTTPTVDTDA